MEMQASPREIADINEAPYFVTSNAAAFEVIETWPVGQALDHVQIMVSDPDNADLLLKGRPPPSRPSSSPSRTCAA
jgi:hypothetical protein